MCGLSPFLLVTHCVTTEGHCCISVSLNMPVIPMGMSLLGAGVEVSRVQHCCGELCWCYGLCPAAMG